MISTSDGRAQCPNVWQASLRSIDYVFINIMIMKRRGSGLRNFMNLVLSSYDSIPEVIVIEKSICKQLMVVRLPNHSSPTMSLTRKL